MLTKQTKYNYKIKNKNVIHENDGKSVRITKPTRRSHEGQ